MCDVLSELLDILWLCSEAGTRDGTKQVLLLADRAVLMYVVRWSLLMKSWHTTLEHELYLRKFRPWFGFTFEKLSY